jgi:cutinase
MRLVAINPRAQRFVSPAAAAFIAAAALLLTPPLPPLASASCPDVEAVFARGTGEPPGVGRVGGAFISSLRQQTRQSVRALRGELLGQQRLSGRRGRRQ